MREGVIGNKDAQARRCFPHLVPCQDTRTSAAKRTRRHGAASRIWSWRQDVEILVVFFFNGWWYKDSGVELTFSQQHLQHNLQSNFIMTTLVTGGTGKTGGHVSGLLHDAGHPLVVASRKGVAPEPLKAAKFDYNDPTTFENPFIADSNIDRLLLIVPDVDDQLGTARPFIDFALTKGVKWIVFITFHCLECPFGSKVSQPCLEVYLHSWGRIHHTSAHLVHWYGLYSAVYAHAYALFSQKTFPTSLANSSFTKAPSQPWQGTHACLSSVSRTSPRRHSMRSPRKRVPIQTFTFWELKSTPTMRCVSL